MVSNIQVPCLGHLLPPQLQARAAWVPRVHSQLHDATAFCHYHRSHTEFVGAAATLQVQEGHCPWRQRSSFDLLQLPAAKNPTPPVAPSLNLRKAPHLPKFRETNLKTKTSAEILRHQPELPKSVSLPWQFCIRSHLQLPMPHLTLQSTQNTLALQEKT